MPWDDLNGPKDLTDAILQDGYRDMLKLADNFAAFNQRLKYAHYRPTVSVKSDPRSWWKYACNVVTDQIKKARYWRSYPLLLLGAMRFAVLAMSCYACSNYQVSPFCMGSIIYLVKSRHHYYLSFSICFSNLSY